MNAAVGGSACEQAIRFLTTGDPAPTPDTLRRMRTHVAGCPRCASLLDDDRGPEIALAALRREEVGAARWWRVTLAALSIAQLALALPWLVGANPLWLFDGQTETAHLTRDGALGVVIGSAGLLAAWRPRYVVGAFALALVALLAHLATAITDWSSDRVSVPFEGVHLLSLLIPVLILVGLRRLRIPPLTRRPPIPVRLARDD